MDAGILAIVGGIGTVIGILLNLNRYSKDKEKEVRTNASEQAMINTKLDIIANGVDSVRLDNKSLQNDINKVMQELARNEEKVDSAHKRIDKLEGHFRGN